MTLTQHGPSCDVCDQYILLTPVHAFSIFGVDGLHCDPACKAKILALDTTKTEFWADLPDGRVRRLAEELAALLVEGER